MGKEPNSEAPADVLIRHKKYDQLIFDDLQSSVTHFLDTVLAGILLFLNLSKIGWGKVVE